MDVNLLGRSDVAFQLQFQLTFLESAGPHATDVRRAGESPACPAASRATRTRWKSEVKNGGRSRLKVPRSRSLGKKLLLREQLRRDAAAELTGKIEEDVGGCHLS